MGYGSYRASDWDKLRSSRGINDNSSVNQIFRGNDLSEKYDPRFIEMRESCDSNDSPLSTPIILGFDVTGSMGYLAAEIAKNSLNRTITEIYDKKPVTDPHVMCAAFTGARCDGALQVTQFEADIRVVEQLLELKVGFGVNHYSYDSLVWYFAGKHTRIDCYEKRRKKGFIFCIGDEICDGANDNHISSSEIFRIYKDDSKKDYTLAELYEMAAGKYEIFHIVTGDTRAIKSWNKFMRGRVAYLNEKKIDKLSEVITAIMQVKNGMSKKEVISQWDGEAKEAVEEALKTIKVK